MAHCMTHIRRYVYLSIGVIMGNIIKSVRINVYIPKKLKVIVIRPVTGVRYWITEHWVMRPGRGTAPQSTGS